MKHLKHVFIAAVMVSLLLPLQGCYQETAREEGIRFAEMVFATIAEKDFQGVVALCADDFFKKSSEEEYLTILSASNKKLGDLKTYELIKSDIKSYPRIGTYYIMDFQTEYEKYPAVEQLTLYKPVGEDEIKILGHNINSIGFIVE